MTNSDTAAGSAFVTAVLLIAIARTNAVQAADSYVEQVVPFAKKYCVECHSATKSRGELDLTKYASADDVTREFRRWNHIIEFIREGNMPPEDATLQPTIAERKAAADAIESLLLAEARKHAGDPGKVLPRRLSNTEFDLSVRDLTGVDIRPTHDFPADPAGGEGFNNTGEALTMSPSLLRKYLAATQLVSDHLVLETTGITFAPFPVTSYNERKKLTEQAIIDFYEQHAIRLRDYLLAAWRYRHRADSERNVSRADWATRGGLSPRYFELLAGLLDEASSGTGYLRHIGGLWNAVPAPTASDPKVVPAELQQLEQYIDFVRRQWAPREEQLIRSNAGNWPIQHLDFRAKTAAARDVFSPSAYRQQQLLRFDPLKPPRENEAPRDVTLFVKIDPAFEATADASRGFVLLQKPIFTRSDNLPRNEDDLRTHEVITLKALLTEHAPELAERLHFGRHPLGHEIDADSLAIAAPTVLEIPCSAELIKVIDGRRLITQCELDPQHSREGAIHLQYATGRRPEQDLGPQVELLMFADSAIARDITPSAEAFCRVFPNRFFYVDRERGLAAGFHLVEGFFRDDQPLCSKVLSESELQELDHLWHELDFVTQSAETLLRGFVWFERSERHVLHDKRFDFLRSEDPALVKESLLGRFEREYLDKMGVKLLPDVIEPEQPNDRFDLIHDFFDDIRAGLQKQDELLVVAEQRGLSDLEELAARAWHRPLTADDSASLRRLYADLRKHGSSVEDALRGVFASVLMSPDFSYRYVEAIPGSDVQPLDDYAVAARLSYFLWSSLPDEELLAAARDGRLQESEELVRQTRRMLQDPRITAFAREFPGQWLRYRDYLEKDPIVAEAFPGYTDELRAAMYEEPTRLLTMLIQQDRPVTELLTSDATFVNGVLAKHYGGDLARQYQEQVSLWRTEQESLPAAATGASNAALKPDQIWHRVEGLRQSGRGGVFGMAVVLTKNSAGERTSPVKRGFWTVHHLLGQHFPPPPADVPELPKNEKDSPRTIRDLLAAHVENPRCALCHVHFDGLGLAMEGFDPIGRTRTKDLAGRPIDNVAILPNGESAQGVPGLIDYVVQQRRDDFVKTFGRRFLGYALGRSVLLSDQPLLDELTESLKQNDDRFSVLFETVVRSPQFRQQRGADFQP